MRGLVLRQWLFCLRGLVVRHSVRRDLCFRFVDAMKRMRLLPLYGVQLLVAWYYGVMWLMVWWYRCSVV